MSGHTGTEHDHQHHTPGDSSDSPKHRFGDTASTVAGKTVSLITAKLPTKASRIVAAATVGTLVLGGAGTAYAVHQNDVTSHDKQVTAEAAAVKLAADQKAAADKAAADAAAKEAADEAAADAAAKAAADKAAADAAAKAAADKAAADKLAADRAAAAAAANRDAQRQQLPSSAPSTTSAPKPTATPKPTTSTPKPPVAYGSAYDIAKSMVPASQFGCFANIIQRESGWNVHATNPGSGAYGLGQALPGSKMASAGSDWRDNPATQIKWVLSYMDSRYGSPCGAWSFWQSHNWY
ncbi:transglycosylase SLT domain-containing protein [Catenulispora subtropica]|uniref:Transglycosylase SLT domain-containing protein n=1 Tax=Catenulispora subtropica TaxID=450798 RepID=A0ABN2RP08_9ACTN